MFLLNIRHEPSAQSGSGGTFNFDNLTLPKYLLTFPPLEKITFVKDEDFVKNAENLSDNIIDNTDDGIGIDVNINEDFVKSIIKG